MKIFLSWSGDRSRAIAAALRDWLPLVLHYVEPWLSERDIAAGERWAVQIGNELEGTHFGVIVLTRDNLEAPWILFEAGALSKAFTAASVCPYLVDIELKDLSGPLAQFQAKKSDRQSTLDLLHAINTKASHPLDGARLSELFDALWSRLEKRLAELPIAADDAPASVRSTPEVIEELVAVNRRMEARLERVEALLSALGSPDIAYPRQQRKVRVKNAGAFPSLGSVSEFEVIARSNLIHDVAAAAGLSMETYQKDWWFQDLAGRDIKLSEGARLARNPPSGDGPAYMVTDVPF